MTRYIVITGPTATGKTALAVEVCRHISGEVISCDSRQVYCHMDIGTGKDLSEYGTGSNAVPYHLIDIARPGEEYNLFRFRRDFINAFKDIVARNKVPVLCGGTGMYLDSIVRKYELHEVPVNHKLREELSGRSLEALVDELKSFTDVHNTTDTLDRDRAIRAIEIARFNRDNPRVIEKDREELDFLKSIKSTIFLLAPDDRQVLRKRISVRLEQRLNNGLVEEVQRLLDMGVTKERLCLYGLEYRFVTEYIFGEMSFNELRAKLAVAIHQFAARQIRWFRRMERKGVPMIHIDSESERSVIVARVINEYKSSMNTRVGEE